MLVSSLIYLGFFCFFCTGNKVFCFLNDLVDVFIFTFLGVSFILYRGKDYNTWTQKRCTEVFIQQYRGYKT